MSMKPKPKKAPPALTPGVMSFMDSMGILMSKVGLVGFGAIVLTAILFFFTTPAQKQEVVDTWVLLKNDNHRYCTILVCALLFLLIIQQLHYHRVNRLTQDRLKEMAAEKTALQKLLGLKHVGSSDSR